MLRPAERADRAAVLKCLSQVPHHAMFQLSHLQKHPGIGSGMRFWLRGSPGVSDVLTVTGAGIVLPFLPNALYLGAARVLAGQEVNGVIGPQDQVRALLMHLRLDHCGTTLDVDEPQFALRLSELIVPPREGRLRPLQDADRVTILNWMTDYQIMTLRAPADLARERATAGYAAALETDNRRVLMSGDTPLSITAFNAQTEDAVQIGGVYTPPSLRGRGYGRRVVGLHLAEAATKGAKRAFLSAANVAAARAYTSLGFQRIGDWSFVLFDRPERVGTNG